MISFGLLKIYWYGFFIVLGFLSAFLVVLFLAKKYKIERDFIVDLVFYSFIFGIIGARIYDIFLEWPYYVQNPVDIFKIWQGGLAIHGAIIAGIVVIVFFAKKKNIKGLDDGFRKNLFRLGSIMVSGLALGQAIGRWGNYFNQELFGRPTNLAWGIFIDPANRPLEYLNFNYFHPTFLYESLGCLVLFFFLISFHRLFIKRGINGFKSSFFLVASYFLFYSALRFFLEFIRIDFTPEVWGLRLPQIVSLVIFLFFFFYFLSFLDKRFFKFKKRIL
jgi:phosphatidylglycerol:prolipoprotein diacylglycerol transferase